MDIIDGRRNPVAKHVRVTRLVEAPLGQPFVSLQGHPACNHSALILVVFDLFQTNMFMKNTVKTLRFLTHKCCLGG